MVINYHSPNLLLFITYPIFRWSEYFMQVFWLAHGIVFSFP